MKPETREYIKRILEKEGIEPTEEAIDAFIVGQKVGYSDGMLQIYKKMQELYGYDAATKLVPEGLYR